MVNDMEQNKMFTVSIDKEFDVMKKEFNNSIYLRVYTSLFQAGIVKDLKANKFTVLLAIASFMDAEGNCYPTQRQISEITGMSTPTVNKAINELLDYTVDGKSILKREMVQQGQFKNSYYTVNPISQIAIFEGQVKEIETEPVKESLADPLKKFTLNNNQETISNKQDISESITFKNSKEVAVYFADRYREQFDVNYNIIFKRDLPLIKNKLIGTFTDSQIKTMIDVTISEYEARWKNPSFPRPTISAMISWIGQNALAIADDGKKEFSELTDLTSGAEEETDETMKKFGI
jgi:DNA-binding transcriptional regulator GbsR (MarR family)